ncbi:hypothetical protein [Marinomonas sp. BSi20584]|uniref:hypothetical protein n=1 Tax=Marinomonas sp. BSi20584 TaxID=1594462 RepID=UPI000C1DD40B|nr:hypothetical protein [Marinomonas sp. BSi20584]PJE54123.1 hypothetical protein TY87_16990 [Marinomonas sp. BSi20584]
MKLQIHYDNKFSTEELDKLNSFEPVLRENWIEKSNSTSSLIWEIVIEAKEPRIYALLKAQSNNKQIYKATCASILNMSSESFENEFVEAAINFTVR